MLITVIGYAFGNSSLAKQRGKFATDYLDSKVDVRMNLGFVSTRAIPRVVVMTTKLWSTARRRMFSKGVRSEHRQRLHFGDAQNLENLFNAPTMSASCVARGAGHAEISTRSWCELQT